MQTIITKACNELGIKSVPSKRVCVVLCSMAKVLYFLK